MSGDRVHLVGDALAAVVHGLASVHQTQASPPVVIGGLAVLCRLSTPHRATTDLDIVDRLLGPVPTLEVLRATAGAEAAEPAAVYLPTPYGRVKVDVLEVRDVDLDPPADDVGDRLHATSHAWAHDTAGPFTIEVHSPGAPVVEATTLVAEPGPLVAMKVQAVMNRETAKQGTDLLDVVRLTTDPICGPVALGQLATTDDQLARDIRQHTAHWFVEHRRRSMTWIGRTGLAHGVDEDTLALVAELVEEATAR